MSEINMNQFERMVKWGAQPKRLAESFGISESYARKLVKGLGAETAAIKRIRENEHKTEVAAKMIIAGGMSVREAARTVGTTTAVLRKRGLRTSQTILERNEVVGVRARVQEEPPTYANGRLQTLGI